MPEAIEGLWNKRHVVIPKDGQPATQPVFMSLSRMIEVPRLQAKHTE
jgi:hypothetical protein